MQLIKKYTTLIIVSIVSLAVGRYVLQPKTTVETKEVVKYVTVYKEKKEEKKKKKTTVTERTNPDGTKETTTVITEDDSVVTDSSGGTKIETESIKITSNTSRLSLSLLAIKDIPNPSKPIAYGAVISVPIVGSLNATGMVTTERQIGIGLGISF